MSTLAIEGWVPSLDTFADRLAAVRHEMGWNIKEAALACVVPPTSWRQWELEGRKPHNYVEIVERISQRSRCDYGWLLDGRPSGGPFGDPVESPVPEAAPTKREVAGSNPAGGTFGRHLRVAA